jgi:hypothetical protein
MRRKETLIEQFVYSLKKLGETMFSVSVYALILGVNQIRNNTNPMELLRSFERKAVSWGAS